MAQNYTFTDNVVLLPDPLGALPVPYKMIKTPLSNIETHTIGKAISGTSYIGINGGFFEADNGYNKPPTGGSAICYNYNDVNEYIFVEGQKLSKNFHFNQGSSGNKLNRKTMIIYNDGNQTKAKYAYLSSKDEAFNIATNITNIIGGMDYNVDSWGSIAYYLPTNRTILAWKDNYAYLLTFENESIPNLKAAMPELGLSAEHSIILDGSGSSQLQVEVDGNLKCYGGNRYIYNMIRLLKTY
jgi:hypothetical protein